MQSLLILFSAGIILTIGDLIAGKWITSKRAYLHHIAIIVYMIGLNLLIYSYRLEEIAIASITMEIFNILTLTLVGRFFFKENITKTEFAGIATGILAVIILEIA